MDRSLYSAWRDHPARRVLAAAAEGRQPDSDDLAAVGGSPEAQEGLRSFAEQLLAVTPEPGRGRGELRRLADESSAAWLALHGDVPPPDGLSVDELADADAAVDRLAESRRGVW